MNVVGKHIIAVDQRRRAFLQTLNGQTIRRVNAGRTQDADGDAGTCAPGAQGGLGIDAARSAGALGIEAARLVDLRPATIAVNPCRAYVNQAAW